MHHCKKGRKLNRNSSHRLLMLYNMASSLFLHEVIKTTLPKAKELRYIIEPIITLAKIDNIANRRLVFSYIHNNMIIAKLFNELGPRFTMRSGGYTSITKCGFRIGDRAPMAYIKLINHNDTETNRI